MIKKPLTMEERIRLAEEGYDIYGKDARLFPPPIAVDENGQPLDWNKRSGRVEFPEATTQPFDYRGFAEARCPAPELSLYKPI